MGVDTVACRRAVPHQQPHHLRGAIEDRVVQHLQIVERGPPKLRTHAQRAAHVLEIVGGDGIAQAPDGHAVDEGFQRGPALEAVGARQHELRVVQRERLRMQIAEMSAHLGQHVRRARLDALEQLRACRRS